MSHRPDANERFRGVLLGTAVGDALGLPAEGLSRRRMRRRFGGPWEHRFVLGRGMISDDTEHAFFAGQALLASADSPERFARSLAWSLRLWLAGLPAGIGFATLRALIRLWAGMPPSRSGVFSAGNGPAMRAAPIGAFHAARPDVLERFVQASTLMTHTDPRAETGALAVAHITAWCIRDDLTERPSPDAFAQLLRACAPEDAEWCDAIRRMEDAMAADAPVGSFAALLGLDSGITGYMYHTVPVAAYAWFRHFGSFSHTLTAVLDCGGDTDTTGAIAGAMAGAVTGERGIPARWIDGVVDWPRGIPLLRRMADHLAGRCRGAEGLGPLSYCWPAIPFRNAVFLGLVLSHGARRLLPPY